MLKSSPLILFLLLIQEHYSRIKLSKIHNQYVHHNPYFFIINLRDILIIPFMQRGLSFYYKKNPLLMIMIDLTVLKYFWLIRPFIKNILSLYFKINLILLAIHFYRASEKHYLNYPKLELL